MAKPKKAFVVSAAVAVTALGAGGGSFQPRQR